MTYFQQEQKRGKSIEKLKSGRGWSSKEEK